MVPLVLLPGMNCTAELWAECDLTGPVLIPALDETSVDAQVVRLLAELPPVFRLAGLSLGGIVALALAIRAPQRVVGLWVMSTNAKAPTGAQRAGWHSWLKRLDGGESPRALQNDIMSELLSSRVRRTRPDLIERALAMADATGAATLRAQLLMQLSRIDLRASLHTVRTPTLVISGQMDVMCPPSFHAEIASGIAGAALVSVEGGHLLPLEQPHTVGALMREAVRAT